MVAADSRAKPGEKQDGELRDEYRRDADRLVYASALRRLGGVTQVISPVDQYIYHDRLTHSLKVAQVAKTLAHRLGPRVNGDVVEAASLAHDLGHPPFGHAAESELMNVLDGKVLRNGDRVGDNNGAIPILHDSFEGNAQTFRIVARIAARKFDERTYGLNLTYRTLAAVLKYPWARGHAPTKYEVLSVEKWGAYASEEDVRKKALEVAADAQLLGPIRSVEADIMDWADDISYAVHDTEDFFRAGILPLDTLFHSDALWGDFLRFCEAAIRSRKVQDWAFEDGDFHQAADGIRGQLPHDAYAGDYASREALHRFGSLNIDGLLKEAYIDSENELCIDPSRRMRAEILKKLTRYFVIDTADMHFEQAGHRAMIRRLFFVLHERAISAYSKRGSGSELSRTLPARFADYCDAALAAGERDGYGSAGQRLARATIDFICSLTDVQAELMARQIEGVQKPGTSLRSV